MIGSFDSTTKRVELQMKGSIFQTNATITNNAQTLARIHRERFNARQVLGGKTTYSVTISPGVDIAMIVAMCICLEEMEEENRRRREEAARSGVIPSYI
jgi:uncharacterized protein YxjI